MLTWHFGCERTQIHASLDRNVGWTNRRFINCAPFAIWSGPYVSRTCCQGIALARVLCYPATSLSTFIVFTSTLLHFATTPLHRVVSHSFRSHTHTRTHARPPARPPARTHARTHALYPKPSTAKHGQFRALQPRNIFPAII